ncbi:S58 family peptidase [Virgibacillus dakarensis]|uniref:DmpA family aminopeptidase n=1 Tax=Virgibacillus dakarensis TaxID=1917889 RepID=UPI000B432B10|nr:P1 family peptidase [Virgibacillus dakarensis]MTW88019.1 S58 family peptidase [Virgibacillus dakarensis]
MTKIYRARDLGLPFPGETGIYNAITDVPGVEVGFTTIMEGEGVLKVGEGPVRTGVTAILPRGIKDRMQPIWAGHYNLNGNGEMTGTHWINDAGYFMSPICLTNTHSVGISHHAITKWMIQNYKKQFHEEHLWAMPVVAETYDGVLNDINGQHVTVKHVLSAIQSAKSGPVSEGNVGGGTGMICYEFKGGTGTSSRVVDIDGEIYHIGALVQANHGIRDWLTVLGVPVGKHLIANQLLTEEQGSIIVIIGTDIPMLPNQLKRVAKRAAIGIGRNGTPGGNNSGDIFLAFSVANEKEIPQVSKKKMNMEFINDEAFDPIYEAVCQAVEESVVNAMVAAETMSTLKPYGKHVHAIDHEHLIEVMKKYNKIV